MHTTYFERLHREEQRQQECQMLDVALRTAQSTTPTPTRKVRMAVGGLLIQAGTALSGK